MTVSIFLVGLALVAAISFFVAAAFFRPRPATGPADHPGERERW